MDAKTDKKIHGRFYTRANPFRAALFAAWWRAIPDHHDATILEPFAGENHIIALLRSANITNRFVAFDIKKPDHNETPDVAIRQQDTLQQFPKNFRVVITNPPYLAKNSAKRDRLPYPATAHDDLYKLSLDVMLAHSDYVAAIIPESFLTAGLFHQRLFGVVSLNYEMFADTDCPVCLALFVPLGDKLAQPNNFVIYRGDKKIGDYESLRRKVITSPIKKHWRFNDPKGEIGLYAIDKTSGPTIQFLRGEEINSRDIKHTNRGITRIAGSTGLEGLEGLGGLKGSGRLEGSEGSEGLERRDKIIALANDILAQYRHDTADIFMTAFRGLRKDGDYRRRLSFADANIILNCASRG